MSDFLRKKHLTRYLGKGVKAEHLNDDALGRTLDKCYEYGVMQLFAEIANEVYLDFFGQEERQVLHLDTTSFSLHGEYDIDYKNQDDLPALPMYGYSKDHRPDLKQMMMSLTVSGSAQMPVWFEPLDGNSQDKTNFHNTLACIKAFREQLKQAPDTTVVADSALYVNDELKNAFYHWITRIPNHITLIKQLREADESQFSWIELDDDNQGAWFGHTERGLTQCNLMVYSKQAAKKQLKTLESQIQEEKDRIEREANKLAKKELFCRADAEQAFEQFAKTVKYHDVSYQLVEIKKYPSKGRPKKGAKQEFSHYQIETAFTPSEDRQRPYRNRVGRFVLATNHFDMSPKAVLDSYKSQQGVERGFRLIKDPAFHLDNLFLKRPERINALMMIMTFSLMVYNPGQYQFRESLKRNNETILSQTNKPTFTPTLRWIFQVMSTVHVVTIKGQGSAISGITPEKRKILTLFGSEVSRIYNIA